MVRPAKKDCKIVKPDDKQWNEWFSGLKENEHDKILSQLGLDKEDIGEWHQSHGKLDTLLAVEETEAPKKGKK